jgi:hypothetical protein
MALELILARRRQRRVTQIAFGIAIGIHVLAFAFFKYTPAGKEALAAIIEIKESLLPPPPPPPPPPDLKTKMSAPPPVNMTFTVKAITNAPSIKADFDVGALGLGNDLDAVDITTQAMTFNTNDVTNMVSGAQLPVVNLMQSIGFDIGTVSTDDAKASITGKNRRASGYTAIAILDIPGSEEGSKWTKGELETIADFVSKSTSIKIKLAARAVSFTSPYSSFATWLTEAKKRARGEAKELSSQEQEISGQEILASSMPYVAEGDFEQARIRVRRLATDYLRLKFEARLDVTTQDWVAACSTSTPTLREWEKEYIRDAGRSFADFYGKKSPTGKELNGVYLMLRMFEMSQLPILFCDPRGVLDMPSPENVRMLRTYLQSGGFIYFINTSNFKKERSIVGLITDLINEKLSDPVGEKTLAKLAVEDQEVSGYVFRAPEPAIGHPWIFFPMILPRTTTVSLAIYNKIGNLVYTDTLKNKPPGAYLQKNRHYRWLCTDNQGTPVEPGYYVYQIKADLSVRTGPVGVSKLLKLTNGKHGVFSSFFNISEVPSKVTIKSEELSYGEPGVFGVAFRGRMCILYTEGYQEKDPLGADDPAAKEAALKWMTNVIIYAVSDRGLAR